MKKLPAGELLAATRRALEDAPRLGLSIQDVATLIKRSYGTAKTTLWRLERLGQCWRISVRGYAAVHFATEEARDAVRAEVELMFKAVGRRRHEAIRQRARDNGATDATTCEVLADHLKRVLPAGITLADATEVTGRTYHAVKKAMTRMVAVGEKAWSISRPGFAMYFGSREARDAAAAAGVGAKKPRPRAEPKPRKSRAQAGRLAPKPEFAFGERAAEKKAPQPKVPPTIDSSRAKVTVEPAKPYLANRWHIEGPVVGGFRTMGIGRYLQDHLGFGKDGAS